jgi:AraC-like DNA-binding protein
MKILSDILSIGTIYGSGMPTWVKRTKELINDGELGSLCLKYISETAGIHPMHLSRDFQRYFNTSFSGYVRKVRIEKARAMLINDELPLASIANDCGFSDQSHFTRVFKGFTGVTPLQYRAMAHTRLL